MPRGFDNCVNQGGRVITKRLSKNRYIHICYADNGKSYSGKVKKRRKK